MILPDLKKYRDSFIEQGISYPLNIVPAKSDGLLKYLPVITDKTGWPWTEETGPQLYSGESSWPKVTIVTPSFNQEKFIEQTIRAVLLQNYPNLEYIVIDGGSMDGSQAIIEKYAPWISYWQSKKDRGQGNAINLGFSLASGNYYSWINSDDYYLKNVFHEVISTFLSKKIDFIYGYTYNFKTTDGKFELVTTDPFLDYFIRLPTLSQPSCFWNAAIHQPIWEELQCSLDYELWLRMVKGRSRKLLRKPLAVANVHKDAKTSDPKMKAAWEQDHHLICRTDAHGPVYNWNRIIFWKRIYHRVNRLFDKLNIIKIFND